MTTARLLLALAASTALCPLAAGDCNEFTTMQTCVFAQVPGETCKWVHHNNRCLCTSSDDDHYLLPACDGNDPPSSDSVLDTNQVLMSVFIALTIVACGCCMCLLLLRPSGISLSTNAAELQPLAATDMPPQAADHHATLYANEALRPQPPAAQVVPQYFPGVVPQPTYAFLGYPYATMQQ
jgi:hypothetical protein